MKLAYKGFIYESTLLEMPNRISLDDDQITSNAESAIEKLLANTEEVDSQFADGVDWSIRESTNGADALIISNNAGEPLGYVKFTKLHTIKNAIIIIMTYLYENSRGYGIMSKGYEYLINYYGTIVSDSDLTDDSYNLYSKLAKKYNSYIYDYDNKSILPIKFESDEYNTLDTKAHIDGTNNNYRVVISKNNLI